MTDAKERNYSLYIRDRDFYHQHKYAYVPETSTYKTSFHVVSEPGENSSAPLHQKPQFGTISKHYVLDKFKLPEYLDPAVLDIVVIDSIKSGKGRASLEVESAHTEKPFDMYEDLILPILKALGLEHQHQYHRTVSEASTDELARGMKDLVAGNSKGPQRQVTVILLSGDTSIHEFVNGLSRLPQNETRKLNVGVVPLGTGNALSLELGIASEVEAVLKIFSGSSTVKPFPLYQASFSRGSHFYDPGNEKQQEKAPVDTLVFFVVLSWGLHAAIVADSDNPGYRKLGSNRFKVAALENIHHVKQDYQGLVAISGGAASGVTEEDMLLLSSATSHGYFLFALGKALEPGFVVSPHSDLVGSKAYLVDIPFIEEGHAQGTLKQPEVFDNLQGESQNKESSGKPVFTQQNQFLLDILGKVYNHSSHIHDKRVHYVPLRHDQEFSLTVKAGQAVKKRRVCVDGRIVVLGGESEDASLTVKNLGSFYNGWELGLIIG